MVLSDIKQRGLIINLFLIFLSILIFFASFELILRLELIPFNERSYKFCGNTTDRSIQNPKFGWVGRPSAKYLEKRSTSDDWSLYILNKEGFRDVFDRGKKNIIVLGDSQTQGVLVDQNSTFVHLLDRWTNITVFKNYGVSGYGTDNEFMLYNSFSNHTEHILVILMYFLGNDARENVEQDPLSPIFNLTSEGLILERLPKNKTRRSGGLIGNPTLGKFQSFLQKHTDIYDFLAPKIRSLFRKKQSPPKGEYLNKQLLLTELLVKEMAKNVKTNRADFLIITIPRKSEITSEIQNPSQYSEYDSYWNSQRKILKDIASNNSSINYMDLKPYLKKGSMKKENIYGKINKHLDDSGHRVIAKAIYKRLVQENYIQNNTPNFTKDYSKEINECPK